MWQELDRDSFIEARGFVANAESGAALLICNEYELHIDAAKSKKLGRWAYFTKPKHDMKVRHSLPLPEESGWREYEPLGADPDLFFKFARLYEAERSPETVLKWTNEHGPLLCSRSTYMDRHGFTPRETTREYVDDFFEEVDRAATILNLYEAVLNRDKKAVKATIAHGPSPVLEELYAEWCTDPDRVKEDKYLMGFGLYALMLEVSRMVRTYAYQQLYIPVEQTDYLVTSRIKHGWGFDNLLGAMYLQMYWVLAAGGKNVTYCKYCGKLISLTTRTTNPDAHSKSRKTRQDKQYCDNRCQQRHYYHTKEKFRRQGKQQENQ